MEMAGPTKNSEGGKKMSKNEIPKQDPKQKKGLTNALKSVSYTHLTLPTNREV